MIYNKKILTGLDQSEYEHPFDQKALAALKPASASGVYLKQVAISSTQGVGVKVSVASILG